MVTSKPTAIYVSFDDLEATIDSTGTARNFWAHIYTIGDEFAAHGASLPLHLKAILTAQHQPRTKQDREIIRLYRLAEQEAATQKRLYLDMQRNMRIDPTDADTSMLEQASFRRRAARMRARVDLFGDRAAIEKYARRIGLAADVFNMLDHIEERLGVLTEELEDLQPQWDIAQRDFRRRLDRGELVQDPLRGWVERNELRNIGGRTRITDISSPASWDEIEEESCPICLEAITTPQQAVCLSTCGHVIDAVCLDTWVNSLAERCNTCVLCRRELFCRQPREPTGYMEWFRDLQGQVGELEGQVETLRFDAQQLVEIMEEIQPSRVAKSLGR